MSISTAHFAVQRGDTTYSCAGSELSEQMQSGDLLLVLRGGRNCQYTVDDILGDIEDDDQLVVTDVDDENYLVSGQDFKDLFLSRLIEEYPPFIDGINTVDNIVRLIDPGSVTEGRPPYTQGSTNWFLHDPDNPSNKDVPVPPAVSDGFGTKHLIYYPKTSRPDRKTFQLNYVQDGSSDEFTIAHCPGYENDWRDITWEPSNGWVRRYNNNLKLLEEWPLDPGGDINLPKDPSVNVTGSHNSCWKIETKNEVWNTVRMNITGGLFLHPRHYHFIKTLSGAFQVHSTDGNDDGSDLPGQSYRIHNDEIGHRGVGYNPHNRYGWPCRSHWVDTKDYGDLATGAWVSNDSWAYNFYMYFHKRNGNKLAYQYREHVSNGATQPNPNNDKLDICELGPNDTSTKGPFYVINAYWTKRYEPLAIFCKTKIIVWQEGVGVIQTIEVPELASKLTEAWMGRVDMEQGKIITDGYEVDFGGNYIIYDHVNPLPGLIGQYSARGYGSQMPINKDKGLYMFNNDTLGETRFILTTTVATNMDDEDERTLLPEHEGKEIYATVRWNDSYRQSLDLKSNKIEVFPSTEETVLQVTKPCEITYDEGSNSYALIPHELNTDETGRDVLINRLDITAYYHYYPIAILPKGIDLNTSDHEQIKHLNPLKYLPHVWGIETKVWDMYWDSLYTPLTANLFLQGTAPFSVNGLSFINHGSSSFVFAKTNQLLMVSPNTDTYCNLLRFAHPVGFRTIRTIESQKITKSLAGGYLLDEISLDEFVTPYLDRITVNMTSKDSVNSASSTTNFEVDPYELLKTLGVPGYN